MDLILFIASNLRCLIARSSSILFSLLALRCEVLDGDKPGGIVAEGGTFKESFFQTSQLKVGWKHRRTRYCFFSLGQCLLSFV